MRGRAGRDIAAADAAETCGTIGGKRLVRMLNSRMADQDRRVAE
jgi:hypothetical protein